MNIKGVFPAHFKTYLTYRLQKRLAFDIARRTAYFGNNHVGVALSADAVNKLLNLVGDVGNNLYRLA